MRSSLTTVLQSLASVSFSHNGSVSATSKRMPEKRSTSSSSRIAMQGPGGGAGISVGALATTSRKPITGRAGTILMRTVSIFLTSGRRISISNTRRQQSALLVPGTNSTGSRNHRTRRTMPDEAKTSAYQAKILDSLKRRTRFTRAELVALFKIYRKLTTSPGQRAGSTLDGKMPTQSAQVVEGIDRTIFRELLHNTFDVITEDTLIERMFCCWDRESEGSIRLDSWILGLDVFLRGNIRERAEFCFRVYDLNNDGYITKDEIFQLFKNCLIKQPGEEDPDEGVRDFSELALKKLDVDHDGKVSYQDYEAAIKREPLLLEAFGQCLPNEESCRAFIMTLQP